MNFKNYSIRLLCKEDLQQYFQMIERNRQRLDFFSGTVSNTKTPEDTKAFVDMILHKAADKTYFPFVIVDNSSNSIIGFLDIKNIEWNIPKAELGCYIDEEYAGKGVSTKALTIFCDHCFNELGFKKLFLRTHQSNLSAQKVAEKCGFEREGIIRNDYKTSSGEIVDLLYYGRLPAK